MNENEDVGIHSGDLIPVDMPKEVNTYDIPELSLGESEEKTQCFNTLKSTHRKVRFICRTYSFLCVVTVFLTLIFSASELIRFVMEDMGAHDMLMKRIFGYGAEDVGDGKALVDLIINKSFADLSLKKNESITPEVNDTAKPTPPKEDTQSPQKPPSISDDKNNGASGITTSPEVSDKKPPSESENMLPIISMDMSLLSYGNNYIYNNSSLALDIDDLRDRILTKRYDESSEAPLVLIIHTHTTEAFMPEGSTCYLNEGEIARSTDPDENMIAVGIEFARVLEENGISTIHCTVIHDAESYRLSYQRSAETIKKYLKEYPSIQYVFDLHRDSIMRSGGELVKAVTSIDGNNCAQIMPVVSVGINEFEENLAFAIKLRDRLNQDYINLSRPICVRESTYNQDLSPVSILLEMGTSGNTLSEVKSSAALTATAVAFIIKNQ